MWPPREAKECLCDLACMYVCVTCFEHDCDDHCFAPLCRERINYILLLLFLQNTCLRSYFEFAIESWGFFKVFASFWYANVAISFICDYAENFSRTNYELTVSLLFVFCRMSSCWPRDFLKVSTTAMWCFLESFLIGRHVASYHFWNLSRRFLSYSKSTIESLFNLHGSSTRSSHHTNCHTNCVATTSEY